MEQASVRQLQMQPWESWWWKFGCRAVIKAEQHVVALISCGGSDCGSRWRNIDWVVYFNRHFCLCGKKKGSDLAPSAFISCKYCSVNGESITIPPLSLSTSAGQSRPSPAGTWVLLGLQPPIGFLSPRQTSLSLPIFPSRCSGSFFFFFFSKPSSGFSSFAAHKRTRNVPLRC